MADILIRGMEMPGCCGDCQFQASRWTGYFCSAGQFMFGIDFDYRDKHQKCPLVPLPAGHGRLGDLDALINELQNLFDKREKDAIFSGDRTVSVTWNDAIYHIIAAPTIVPAEGEVDNGN